MKLFSNLIAESDSLTESIEQIDERIDKLDKRKKDGVETVMYRQEETKIDQAIRDLQQRKKALETLNKGN